MFTQEMRDLVPVIFSDFMEDLSIRVSVAINFYNASNIRETKDFSYPTNFHDERKRVQIKGHNQVVDMSNGIRICTPFPKKNILPTNDS